MKYARTILVLLAVALILFIMLQVSRRPSLETETVKIGNTTVAVAVASTTASREQGLSGSVSLPEGRGMLFVFPQDGAWGFWMKDMNFPIDIIWIDAAGKVITIAASLSPATYPQVFYPAAPSRYVLEVPAGFASRHGIDIGTVAIMPAGLSGTD